LKEYFGLFRYTFRESILRGPSWISLKKGRRVADFQKKVGGAFWEWGKEERKEERSRVSCCFGLFILLILSTTE